VSFTLNSSLNCDQSDLSIPLNKLVILTGYCVSQSHDFQSLPITVAAASEEEKRLKTSSIVRIELARLSLGSGLSQAKKRPSVKLIED
jgi:hypothetical protein